MQFEGEFFNQFDYYLKTNNYSRYQYFTDRFLTLLKRYSFFSIENIKKLTENTLSMNEWGLPAPLLIPCKVIERYSPEISSLYTRKEIEIGNEKYFAFLMWSEKQVSQIYNWYINTICGGYEKYFEDRNKAFAACKRELIRD